MAYKCGKLISAIQQYDIAKIEIQGEKDNHCSSKVTLTKYTDFYTKILGNQFLWKFSIRLTDTWKSAIIFPANCLFQKNSNSACFFLEEHVFEIFAWYNECQKSYKILVNKWLIPIF